MVKIIGVLAGAFLLASCATVQRGAELIGCGAAVTPAQQVACFVKKTQEATVQICGFMPAVATVTGVLGLGVGDAFMIAAQICQVVMATSPTGTPTGRTAAPSGSYGSIKGVPVRGQFVR